MNMLKVSAITIVLALGVVTFVAGGGQNSAWRPPGAEEADAVNRANAQLDSVYKQLMRRLDPEAQIALRDAERSWIKWRDEEARLMGRVTGAIGGSALRVEVLVAQEKLIRQRNSVLRDYLKQVSDRERPRR